MPRRKRKKKSSKDAEFSELKQKYVLAKVPNIPRGVFWPVEVLEWNDGRMKVYCKSDDAVSVGEEIETEAAQSFPARSGMGSGWTFMDAAAEVPRRVRIFGEEIVGKPDLRAYVPVDNECWFRQKPVISSNKMPRKQTLSAVVEVKLSPPNETDTVEQETEKVLGQVVGEMLAELLSFHDVLAGGHTHMLGIMVLSTKVYFVKLYVPESLMDMYRQTSASSCKDKDIEKGTVFITQGFDFMKRKTRLQAIKILHKIGTIM